MFSLGPDDMVITNIWVDKFPFFFISDSSENIPEVITFILIIQ